MPDAVTALMGRMAQGRVTVRDMGLRGMITLRADLSDDRVRAVTTALTGVSFPAVGMAQTSADRGLAWMSPDELLVMVPYADVAAALAQLADALTGVHHLAVDVSDARAVIGVSGAAAREVMAKLTPADMHPDAFRPGMFRRSRLGQVAAAFWMQNDTDFVVVTFRSVADYAFALLVQSAKDGPVGYY